MNEDVLLKCIFFLNLISITLLTIGMAHLTIRLSEHGEKEYTVTEY